MWDMLTNITISKLKMIVLSAGTLSLFYFIVLGSIFTSLAAKFNITDQPIINSITGLSPLPSVGSLAALNDPIRSITDPLLSTSINIYTHPAVVIALSLLLLLPAICGTLIPYFRKQPVRFSVNDVVFPILMYIFVQYAGIFVSSSLHVAILPYNFSILALENLDSMLYFTQTTLSGAIAIYLCIEILMYVLYFLSLKKSNPT